MRFLFGDHVLDIERRELHRGGRPIALEPQVFDLLVHLMTNRDHVVSKDEMIDSVWGGRIVSDATLISRIKAVRQAIGDNGSAQTVIRTIPRKGVRFIAEVQEEAPTRTLASIPAAVELAPLSLPPVTPDKPSVAVLAFDNLSGDAADDPFSDGMADDIITELTRSRNILVIARNSSFTYKNRPAGAEHIGRELRVRYVLRGSVRRSGNQVRVNAQLIDAGTDSHIWADRYDRTLSDIFAVQDDITRSIALATGAAVTKAEWRRAMNKQVDSLDAWESHQRGLAQAAATDLFKAAPFFERAIALDRSFVAPYSLLARLRISEGTRGDRPLPDALGAAEDLVRTASPFDPTDPDLLATRSWITMLRGDREAGLGYAEEAVEHGPSSVHAHLSRGRMLTIHGQPETARQSLVWAKRLSPFDSAVREIDMLTANCFYFEGKYQEAEAVLRRLLDRHPNYNHLHRWIVPTLGQLGRRDEARAAFSHWVSLAPAQVELMTRDRPPWIREEDHDHFLDGLRKAGWNG